MAAPVKGGLEKGFSLSLCSMAKRHGDVEVRRGVGSYLALFIDLQLSYYIMVFCAHIFKVSVTRILPSTASRSAPLTIHEKVNVHVQLPAQGLDTYVASVSDRR